MKQRTLSLRTDEHFHDVILHFLTICLAGFFSSDCSVEHTQMKYSSKAQTYKKKEGNAPKKIFLFVWKCNEVELHFI